MNGRIIAIVCLLLPLAVTACNQQDSRHVAKKPEPITETRNGKIVLGSPSLTAGIPGSGPLSLSEIRAWLAREDVHQPLDFVLPISLEDGAKQIWMPADNPLTRAKIELGRQLFFDGRMSESGGLSCTHCHMPEQCYSAHARMPVGKLNPPVCFNRILSSRQLWDGREESLETQATAPVNTLGEMGLSVEGCIERIEAIEGYRIQFEKIFGKVDRMTIGAALACFQRALVTGPSPWDYHRLLSKYKDRPPESLSEADGKLVDMLRKGAQAHPMSAAAIRGEALFFSERTRCGTCHSGPNLTDEAFYNVGSGMDAPEPPLGRSKVTGRAEDIGAIKTPTLRNIAETSPYMHNGQCDTLEQVVEFFDRGGFVNLHLDRSMRPLNLTREDKRDLVEFHKALTGSLPPVETGRLPE